MTRRTSAQRGFTWLSLGTISAAIAGFIILLLVGGPPSFSALAGVGLGLSLLIGLLMLVGVRLMFKHDEESKHIMNSMFLLGFFLFFVAALIVLFAETLASAPSQLSSGQILVLTMLGIATTYSFLWEAFVLVKSIRERDWTKGPDWE